MEIQINQTFAFHMKIIKIGLTSFIYLYLFAINDLL